MAMEGCRNERGQEMSQDPMGRGRYEGRLRIPKLGTATVGFALVLSVIVVTLVGCSIGATATPEAAVGTVSGSSTTAGPTTTTIASATTSATRFEATSTTHTEATATTRAETMEPADTATATVSTAEAATVSSVGVVTATEDIGLELIIVEVTSFVSPGSSATVRAKTAPGADCSIDVEYKSGKSTAKGLDPKQADAAGDVSWTWCVGRRTASGEYPVLVTASMDGRSLTQKTTFVVK